MLRRTRTSSRPSSPRELGLTLCAALLATLADAACERREIREVIVTSDASTTSAEMPRRTETTRIVTPEAPAPESPATTPPPARPEEAPAPTAAPLPAPPPARHIWEPPLPSWAPDAGRLTIVGAGDRDKNLGVVPADAAVTP